GPPRPRTRRADSGPRVAVVPTRGKGGTVSTPFRRLWRNQHGLEVADPAWLSAALETVATDPSQIARLFPAVSRRCGRGELPNAAAPADAADPSDAADSELAGWTVDDAARVLLLTTLPLRGEALAAE